MRHGLLVRLKYVEVVSVFTNRARGVVEVW